MPNYKVKTRFKDMDISQNICNCCIDQSTFLMSDIYCEDHLLNELNIYKSFLEICLLSVWTQISTPSA